MATVGQRLERLFHADVIPTSWGRKLRIWHVVPVILVAVVVMWATGIRVSIGPSMGNTLGTLYRFQGDVSPEIGQIIVFKQPNRSLKTIVWPSAKRVVRVSEEGIEVQGDNGDQAEDSRDFDLVPHENVLGTIVWVSAFDNFDCWLRLNEPRWREAKKVETDELVIFEIGDYLDIVSKVEKKRVVRLKGQFVDWLTDSSCLVFRQSEKLMQYSVETNKTATLAATKTLNLPWRGKAEVCQSQLGLVCYVEGSFPRQAKVVVNGKARTIIIHKVLDWDIEKKTAEGETMFTFYPQDDLREGEMNITILPPTS